MSSTSSALSRGRNGECTSRRHGAGAGAEEGKLASQRAVPVRVGVFGAGAMGRNHVRNLAAMPEADLVGLYDPSATAAAAVAQEFGTRVFTSVEALAAEVEAAVLAAPTIAHADLGCSLLGRGLHLLVEKPLAASLEEADQLLAATGDRVLGVGHVEYFNPAVQSLLAVGMAPRFIEVQRLGIFSPRSLDVDVVLDLMIHDLQILHALDPSPVREIRATGIPVLSARIDIANVRIEMESGCVANLTASRVSAERIRRLRVFGLNRYYSLDYQAQEIHGYRLVEEGEGRQILPDDLPVEKAEPLRRELEGFLGACRGEDAPRVDGAAARRALATALAVVETIR